MIEIHTLGESTEYKDLNILGKIYTFCVGYVRYHVGLLTGVMEVDVRITRWMIKRRD